MTSYYPIMLKLNEQRIVVIGGGSIATKKITGLLSGGAENLRVIAPQLTDHLHQLAASYDIEWMAMPYDRSLLQSATLVFAATDDAKLNEQISNDAIKYDILVCNVSDGQQGSFITPAIARSGELIAALSSAGASPSLVKIMKQELEQLYLPRYAKALELMKRLRTDVLQSNLNEEQRRKLLTIAAKEALEADLQQYEEWQVSLYNRIVLDEGEDAEDGSKSH